MTRERALKVLEMFLDKQCSIERTLNHMDTTDVEIWDAVHTAVEALSAEPCEDAIDRQYLTGLMFTEADLSDAHACYESIRKIVEEMPSVTPKQKMGRWISFGVQGEIGGQIVRTFTCSECGAISIFRLSGENIVNGDLCPNCGAKMGESEG